MKYVKLPLIVGILYFLNPTHAMELSPITNQEITDGLVTLNKIGKQEFCNNLSNARVTIKKELMDLSDDKDFPSASNIAKVIRASIDYSHLFNSQLCFVGNEPLTLDRFLQFCDLMSPKEDLCFSSATLRSKDVEKMQKELGLDFLVSTSRHILGNFRAIFKNPLSIQPYDISQFSINFDALKKSTDTRDSSTIGNFNVSFKDALVESQTNQGLSFRSIAEGLATMPQDVKGQFCRNIGEVWIQIQGELFPYYMPKDRYSYWENQNLKKARGMLSLFQNKPEEYKEISTFQLASFNGKPLTFEKYLAYCLEIRPQDYKVTPQSWVPFYQEQRHFDTERILTCLGLSPNAQYCEKVQELTETVRDYFKNPFYMDPFNLEQFTITYNELNPMAQSLRGAQPWGRFAEEQIRANKLTIFLFLVSGYFGISYFG